MNEDHLERPGASAAAARPSLDLAIASLILGIVGVLLSVVLLGALLGFVGLICGIVYLRRKQEAGGAMAGWGVGLGIVAIAAGVAFGGVYYRFYLEFVELMADFQDGGADVSEWEGVMAPDLTVRTLDGEEISLSELRGQRVVINFWATWCGPCVREIPHFIRVVEETPTDEVTIIGISDESEAKVRRFVERHGVNYPIGNAANGMEPPYSDVRAIPTTFFIDRNGVIQSVRQGYLSLDRVRELALADDYAGEPREAPGRPESGLQEADEPLRAVLRWSEQADVEMLLAGDWDGDGQEDLLVLEHGRRLRVLDPGGGEKAVLRLPGNFTRISIGRHRDEGVRLLGYTNWGREVVAMDRDGRKLWSYPSRSGVNGVHWGDLTGDGNDEVVVGMNGGGGLHALSPDGEQIWHIGGIGNVWNQAIVPAISGGPALVFATEAGGSVRVFDARGNPLRTIRPQGKYFSQLAAGRMDSSGTIQAVAQGEITVAFDESGNVVWETPARRDHGAWRAPSFSSGDVTGDGVREWVFRDYDNTLIVVTPDGVKVASVPARGDLDAFCVWRPEEGVSLLVTAADGHVHVYRIE